MAVITGFPTAELAQQFAEKFRVLPSSNDQQSAALLGVNSTREEWLSGLERAAAWYLHASESAITPTDVSGRMLKFHWKNMTDHEQLTFPFAVEHERLDVAAVDQQFYDAADEDDDRNYFRLKEERQSKARLAKLESLGKELGLDPSDVERVLHDSRMAMRDELMQRRGKVGRKARDWISVREDKLASKNAATTA